MSQIAIVLLNRQSLLKATRLLYDGIISNDEYEEIKQIYMDSYFMYVNY